MIFSRTLRILNNRKTSSDIILYLGTSYGSVLAMILSWNKDKNFPSVILAGFLSWLYVGYYAINDPYYSRKSIVSPLENIIKRLESET